MEDKRQNNVEPEPMDILSSLKTAMKDYEMWDEELNKVYKTLMEKLNPGEKDHGKGIHILSVVYFTNSGRY
ncbi:lysozyme inhibitor LprI family protein [Thermocrinis albus]|uniref:lysozyme inhibitor LprI family protein n=1 Tax=Thermocrinis albus TaxID=136094 RepID=UPI0002D54D63|nr:lysozyme inhibitor LprI family protein [Thermocrinis albus]